MSEMFIIGPEYIPTKIEHSRNIQVISVPTGYNFAKQPLTLIKGYQNRISPLECHKKGFQFFF